LRQHAYGSDFNGRRDGTSRFSHPCAGHFYLSDKRPDDPEHTRMEALGAEALQQRPTNPDLSAETDFS
jgi:hypothetical protein